MPLEVLKMPRRILTDNGVEEQTGANFLGQARKIAQVYAPYAVSENDMNFAESAAIPNGLPQALRPDESAETRSYLQHDLMKYAKKIRSYNLSYEHYYHLFQWVSLEFGCGSTVDPGWLTWASLVVWGNREAFFQSMPSLLSRDILSQSPTVWFVPTDEIETVIKTNEHHGFVCGLDVAHTHPILLAQNAAFNLMAQNEIPTTYPWPREYFTSGRIPKVTFDDTHEQFSIEWPYITENVVGDPPVSVLLNV